jgi:hypothetical protein
MPRTQVTQTTGDDDDGSGIIMKSDKDFEARIDQHFTLMEQARAARLKYVCALLKSAYDAIVRGIRLAVTSVDRSVIRQDERGTSENG